jgi:MoxR-like ATPase
LGLVLLVDYSEIPKHQVTDENLLQEGPPGIGKLDMAETINSSLDGDGIPSIRAARHENW